MQISPTEPHGTVRPVAMSAILTSVCANVSTNGIPKAASTCRISSGSTVAPPAARVLGLWGHHDGVIAICQDALAGDHDEAVPGRPVPGRPVLDDTVTASLEAELFQSELSGAGPASAPRPARRCSVPWTWPSANAVGGPDSGVHT